MSVGLHPEEYDEYEFPPFTGSPELTREISRASGPTSSSAEIDGIYFRQIHGPTTFAGDTFYSYMQLVEASCSSSPSGLLQQVDTPSLNDNTLSMDLSGKQLSTAPNDDSLTSSAIEDNTYRDPDSTEYRDDEEDFPPSSESPELITEISRTTPLSAEVGDTVTHISQDHQDHNPPVQRGESSQYQSAAQAHNIWTASPAKSKGPGHKCWVCSKELHAKKVWARHYDDCHSDPKPCPGCDMMIVGKRKLVAHLERDHGLVPLEGRPRKPRQQIPKDVPLQIQSTSPQVSSDQVGYAQRWEFGLRQRRVRVTK
jgi:hypothetical protein